MNPTVSDRITRRPDGSRSPRIVGSSVANNWSFAVDLGAGQRVEQGRFSGVGVADQRDHRERHAPPRRTVQAAGAPDLLQLLAQPHQAVVDQPAVGLDLGFTRTAQEAEAAALALKVGPGPDQPGSLICEMREFDLERALLGRRPFAENVQDQAGAVDDLAAPGAFQVALLHRRQGGIDDHHLDLVVAIAWPCAAT